MKEKTKGIIGLTLMIIGGTVMIISSILEYIVNNNISLLLITIPTICLGIFMTKSKGKKNE